MVEAPMPNLADLERRVAELEAQLGPKSAAGASLLAKTPERLVYEAKAAAYMAEVHAKGQSSADRLFLSAVGYEDAPAGGPVMPPFSR